MDKNDKFDTHPISFIDDLRSRFGSDIVLSFSRYKYTPRTRKDERERFSLAIDLVTQTWLRYQLLTLEPMQELALESRVKINGLTRHIPMLDFRGMTKGQLTAIMDVFPNEYTREMHVYFSGRSYHAYFNRLLTAPQWIKFMGSALLCNTPSDPSVIDQRWIGHRLIGGYSALRWSCNSTHYKSYPQRIDSDELDRAFSEKRFLANLAANRIENVTNKEHYYQDLVDMALSDLSVKYTKRVEVDKLGKRDNIDFFIEPGNGKFVGVETAYSDRSHLEKEHILRLSKVASKLAKTHDISSVLLITNTELRKSDKDYLANCIPRVDVIENTVSPDALISRLGRYLQNGN